MARATLASTMASSATSSAGRLAEPRGATKPQVLVHWREPQPEALEWRKLLRPLRLPASGRWVLAEALESENASVARRRHAQKVVQAKSDEEDERRRPRQPEEGALIALHRSALAPECAAGEARAKCWLLSLAIEGRIARGTAVAGGACRRGTRLAVRSDSLNDGVGFCVPSSIVAVTDRARCPDVCGDAISALAECASLGGPA